MKKINYSVSPGNPICSSKNERELRKDGDESNMSASDKSESPERFAVDSIKRVKDSSLQVLVENYLILNSSFIFIQIVHTPQKKHKINQPVQQISKYEQYAYIHEVWEVPIA